MNEAGNSSLIPQNHANFTLLSNAAIVLAAESQGVLQRSNLYYPRVLTTADIKPAVAAPVMKS
jgi:hypothetical protein